MLSYIENILNEFRPLFKRLATFKWFVICVIAMMLRSDQLGVTSVIRDLALAPECYEALIHFFRSSAYSLDVLREQWYRCVLRNAPLTKCRNRIILVGDGVKQSKEGKRMPGVKKMTQESETCSKPHFIHGHMFGALGVIAATKAKRFCMPLKFNIQDGLRSAAAWQEGNEIINISDANHIEQMVRSAFEAAGILGKSYILLDRYFLSRTALRLMDKMNLEKSSGGGTLVEIVTKAKSNCKAYMKPVPKRPGSKGRPRKKGKQICVLDLFDCPDRFTKTCVYLYGGLETVSYYCINLLWGQGLYRELRFVLVLRGTGEKSILVSTDLTNAAKVAAERRMIMKRIMSFLLVAILLFGFSTIAESASEVPSAIDAQSGTDYANADNWAYFGIGEGRAADVFLICPTVDMKDEFNMSLEDEDTKASFLGALNMERGIYEDTARLYAPYYRQAAMKVYSMEPYEREPWLALAYEDISAAFDWYLAHENAGRPIVLAGFSQGADMCYRLLEEYFGDEALYRQLIAVYAIGWPCTEEMTAQYPQIVSATGEYDLGVVVSFDCEAPEVTQTLITPAETRALTINPLNWKTDGTPADRSENLGACFTNYSGEIVREEAGLCGCYIDERRGVVKVPDVDPADYPPIVPGLPEGAYHIYDYQFFFRNLQKNVADRTERFLQTGAPDEVAEETPVTK